MDGGMVFASDSGAVALGALVGIHAATAFGVLGTTVSGR